QEAYDDALFRSTVLQYLGLAENPAITVRQMKRSIDARGRQVIIKVTAEIFIDEPPSYLISANLSYSNVKDKPTLVIVGAGPAGLFAALRAIELGYKPIVLERGKDVQARRRDLAAINKEHIVNPESNYCFGEGGAGTYSDGKLYTRSKKRGDVRSVLDTFVAHGAPDNILFDAHPHIGTNILPKVVANLRQTIIECGGEVHFNTRVTDLIIDRGAVTGVVLATNEKIRGESVILATGHSARDIFGLLHQKGILIEAKPFALGLRVEHAQNL